MSSVPTQIPAGSAAPEKYLIAFVIQGDDVFKITADNIIHTTGTANGPAFDAIAKLKAAAALLELTNRHKERPDELRQMARELAGEGMKLMARASSAIRSVPAPPAAEIPQAAAAPIPPAMAATEPTAEAAITTPSETTHPTQSIPEPPKPVPPHTPRIVSTGPAPVPKPEDRAPDASTLPVNAKIALISG